MCVKSYINFVLNMPFWKLPRDWVCVFLYVIVNNGHSVYGFIVPPPPPPAAVHIYA